MAKDKRDGSFWTSLPGILTGLAAVIAGLTALIAAAGGFVHLFGGDENGSPATTSDTVSIASPTASAVTSSDGQDPNSEGGGFRVVSIIASSFPESGTVPCPPTVTFDGIIGVQGSGEVTYQWLRSDGTEEDPRVLRFAGPGQKRV